MAASNIGCVWRKNLYGAPGPFKFPGSMAAGATTAIKRGEIIKLAAGLWTPEALDEAMAAIIAFDDGEIRNGDFAGYHMIIVPRPGDIFELPLSVAANPSPGASLYVSDSQTLKTAGNNILGAVCDPTMLPLQGFQSVNPSYDAGTTVRTVPKVLFTVRAAASYYAALQL